MSIDWSLLVYEPCETFFGRPMTVTAVKSRAGAVYETRGIINTRPTAIATDIGMVVASDQQTIIDIRERDAAFAGGVPVQGDVIYVPPDNGITDMVGTYVVIDAQLNGGGETTLVVQRQTEPTLVGPFGVSATKFVNTTTFFSPAVST